MNVEIGAVANAMLFPEKEYINGIAVAVRASKLRSASFLFLPYISEPKGLLYFVHFYMKEGLE
jgi:hypothetical protein